MISARRAHAIRMGIRLGRLIALDVALSIPASDPYASWRHVQPYRGCHGRAYRRAIDRAADMESRRILSELATDRGAGDDTQNRTTRM